MASQIFFVNHLAKPFLHHGRIDIIVVCPFLISGVVRRINVYAFNFSGIERKECFQGLQVVPVDDEIVMQADLISQTLVLFGNQLMVFDEQMMVLNERLAFKEYPTC